MEPENVDLALDIFNEMAESLSQDKKNFHESEAFCLVNIIKIKFSVLLNQSLNDIKTYEFLMSRIDLIIDRLELDEDNTKWIRQYEELKEDIEEKKKQLKKLTDDKAQKIKKCLEEINNIYNTKVKEEKKPMDFINFILTKYHYTGFDSNSSILSKGMSIKEVIEDIFPRYHPDNYNNREDFIIYNEIYMLLGKMKEDLIKYK